MEIVSGPVYEFRSSNFCSYTERSDNGDMGNYHCHNFYELYYLERGQRDYLVGQINYPVTEGCFVLVKPHVMHQTFGGAFSRRLIHFGYDFLKQYLSVKAVNDLLTVFDQQIIVPSVDKDSVLKYWNIISDFQKAENYQGLAMGLASILSFLSMYSGSLGLIKGDSLVSRISSYIEENSLEINSLDEIAVEFHISKYYLCHLFQSEKKVSVLDYLTSLKIAHASYELATTSKRIKDIAYECGFQSEYYFSKRFKQVIMMSPREYRNLIINKEKSGIE